jgi:hypothetical protein
MRRGYRDPKLGELHKLDLKRSQVGTVMVPDAALNGLLVLLNASEARSESARIVDILEQMLAVEKMKEPLWGETEAETRIPVIISRGGKTVVNPKLERIAPEKYKLQVDIEYRRRWLNEQLALNRFLPYVWHNSLGRWMVIWRTQSRTPRKTYRLRPGVLDMDDGAAIQLILDLARAGYLTRLRRCQCCRKWLYARFKHQGYCSTKCQQKHYSQSPDWKAKRRDYMRKYRQRTT